MASLLVASLPGGEVTVNRLIHEHAHIKYCLHFKLRSSRYKRESLDKKMLLWLDKSILVIKEDGISNFQTLLTADV